MYAILKKPTADPAKQPTPASRPARKAKACAVPADSGCSCEQFQVIQSAVRDAGPIVSKAIDVIEHLEQSPLASQAFTGLFGALTPDNRDAVVGVLKATSDELGKVAGKAKCIAEDSDQLAARVETTLPAAPNQPVRTRAHYELFPGFFSGETARRPGGNPGAAYLHGASQLQRTRLVIHEAAHKVLNKRSEFYVDTGMLPVLPFVEPRVKGSRGPGVQNADSVAFFAVAASQPRGLEGALSRIGGVRYDDRVDASIAAKKEPLLAVIATARWIARGALVELLSEEPRVPLEPSTFKSLRALPDEQRAQSARAMLEAAQTLFEYHLVIGKARKGLEPEQYLRGSHAFGPLTSNAVDAQRSLPVTIDGSYLTRVNSSMEGSELMTLAYRLINRILEQHGTVFPRAGERTRISSNDAKMLTIFIKNNAPGSL